MAGPPEDGVRWESDGQGEFTVEPVDQGDARHRRHPAPQAEDAKEFLEPWQLRAARQEVLRLRRAPDRHGRREGGGRAEDDVEETLNARKAIWLRQQDRRSRRRSTTSSTSTCRTTTTSPLKTIHYVGRGAHRVQGPALHPGAPAVRPDVGRLEQGAAPVHPARLHHGRLRGAAAALPALRPRRRRFARPAAQRVARDAAAERPAGEDQVEPGQQGAQHARRDEDARSSTATSSSSRSWASSSRKGRARTGATARSSPTCCCSNRRRPSRASSRRWPNTSTACRASRRRSTT